MSGRNYNTRKSNHSRRNTTNEILNKMGRIKEERICEYLLFKIQEENEKDNKYDDDGLNVYEKFTPTTLSLALYFKLCDKHCGKENCFNVPQIISEYSNFNSLSLNELRVCKAIIDKQIDHKDNRAFMKNTLKNLVSKIDNSVEKIYKSQANSEQPEMNQDEPNFYNMDDYLSEASNRLKLILEYISKIEISKLSKEKVRPNELKPRFTDVCVIKNSANDEDEITNEYMIADSEDLYSKVFTDYVIKSARKPDPYTTKLEIHSKLKAAKKNRLSLQIIEEESNRSDLSHVKEEIKSSSESSHSISANSPLFNMLISQDANNIASVRKEIYKLSQFISSKEKLVRSRENSIDEEDQEVYNSVSQYLKESIGSESEYEQESESNSSESEVESPVRRKRKV